MKRLMSLMVFCLVVFAPLAGAHEYALQFTPNAGYRGLVVAGYRFDGDVVVGNCSYYTTSGATSGKGGGGRAPVTKTYLQTCRWDLYGNLLSVTSGAPSIPLPISVNGSQVVFAVNSSGDSSTGTDLTLAERGFVSTPGAHYTWLTSQNNGVLRQMVYTLTATLKSDGDGPLDITAVVPSAQRSIVTLKSTTCIGEIKVGATCSITVTFDPTKITSSTVLALDTLRIDLTSNAGAGHDFIQLFTIILPGRF